MKPLVISAILVLTASPAFAEMGDPAKGEKIFKKCKACHQVGTEAKNKTGPVLNGIVGAEAGTREGFKKYSKPLKAMAEEGLVWTVENLDTFSAKPKKFMKGTKMSFAGLKKESDRADVIAYLARFADDGSEQDAAEAIAAASGE